MYVQPHFEVLIYFMRAKWNYLKFIACLHRTCNIMYSSVYWLHKPLIMSFFHSEDFVEKVSKICRGVVDTCYKTGLDSKVVDRHSCPANKIFFASKRTRIRKFSEKPHYRIEPFVNIVLMSYGHLDPFGYAFDIGQSYCAEFSGIVLYPTIQVSWSRFYTLLLGWRLYLKLIILICISVATNGSCSML